MKTFTLKSDAKSKTGIEIKAGETVTVAFDLKTKSGAPFYAGFSMRTDDGRKINSNNFARLGLKVPSERKLENWSNDGICESIFGETVEPDGTDEHGSPSWLLALGLI